MKSYPIQVRERRSWERNAGRQRRTQTGNVKVTHTHTPQTHKSILEYAYGEKDQALVQKVLTHSG